MNFDLGSYVKDVWDEARIKKYRESVGTYYENPPLNPANMITLQYDPITNTTNLHEPMVFYKDEDGYSLNRDDDPVPEKLVIFDPSPPPSPPPKSDKKMDKKKKKKMKKKKKKARVESNLDPASASPSSASPPRWTLPKPDNKTKKKKKKDLVISGTKLEAEGRSILKRPREDLSESTFVDNLDQSTASVNN